MRYGCAFMVLACLAAVHAFVPAGVAAQGATLASVTGLVRDSSGAVLPGVTVEVFSPVLIERERTAVTDDTGRYRIVNLPPGTYAVTFMLSGFSGVRREGIELAGSFVATVNADLKWARCRKRSPSRAKLQSLTCRARSASRWSRQTFSPRFPQAARTRTGRPRAWIQLNTTAQNVGGINGPAPPFFGGHGGSGTEGRLNMDGIGTGGATGGVSLLIVDTGNAAEITISTTGGLADAEIGGPIINVVPRWGGNLFSGQFFGSGAGPAMQSDNFTDSLKRPACCRPRSSRRCGTSTWRSADRS